jgi:hypothetical protein
MQSPVLLELGGDFAMALKASELRRMSGEGVATDTVCVSVEALVGTGKRAGRDLGDERTRSGKQEENCETEKRSRSAGRLNSREAA